MILSIMYTTDSLRGRLPASGFRSGMGTGVPEEQVVSCGEVGGRLLTCSR